MRAVFEEVAAMVDVVVSEELDNDVARTDTVSRELEIVEPATAGASVALASSDADEDFGNVGFGAFCPPVASAPERTG